MNIEFIVSVNHYYILAQDLLKFLLITEDEDSVLF